MTEETPTPESSQPSMEQHEEQMARTHLEANPGDIPQQFGGDVNKFMDSWKEQRAALTRTQQELAEMKQNAPVAPVEDVPASPEAVVPDSLSVPEPEEQAVGTDVWAQLEQEFAQSGDLSAETREQLAGMNIPSHVIDQYLAGARASQAQAAQQAADFIGGAETLQSIIDWSSKNLSDAERSSVNAALSQPGWETTLMGLKARMETSSPTAREPGPGPQTQSGTPSGAAPYANQAEMVAAIGDPRYGKDPMYTNFVQDRIRLSNQSR